LKNVVLASTSTLYGEPWLAYLQPIIKELFRDAKEIIFVPYARPGGTTHNAYTSRVAEAFHIPVRGLHTFTDPVEAIRNAQGIFTGGGNTFVLVKQLHDLGLMQPLRDAVLRGVPYLGCSAGSNIGGLNMQTTNDMPIVYPPSFDTMGLVPFNLNPHYLDPIPDLPHMGETRETRIKEFHTQQGTPVIGLREGSWIRAKGDDITLEGSKPARIFEQGKTPWEMEPGQAIKFI
jgi:dipeptidase E